MGSLCEPATASLALALRDRFKLNSCVETGTRNGISTAWAAQHFEIVDTIEIDLHAQDAALHRYSEYTNIAWHVGDTRGALPDVVAMLKGPALFWLDAHTNDDCPALDELAAINVSPHRHCILIDDASCFMRPAPAGINSARWPVLSDVWKAMIGRAYSMHVLRDLIVLIPKEGDDMMARLTWPVAPTTD